MLSVKVDQKAILSAIWSIQCLDFCSWDSNPQPLGYKSPPITTKSELLPIVWGTYGDVFYYIRLRPHAFYSCHFILHRYMRRSRTNVWTQCVGNAGTHLLLICFEKFNFFLSKRRWRRCRRCFRRTHSLGRLNQLHSSYSRWSM